MTLGPSFVVTRDMSTGFWAELSTPIFALAPMSGVSDSVFRQLISRHGKPDICFTEFVPCAGLRSPAGRKRLLPSLEFTPGERPLVAQVFGSHPDDFYEAAQLLGELGFDGIDLNTGCPDRRVMKQGAGAALLENPKLIAQIVRAIKRGAGKLPVSIKTRLGYPDVSGFGEWLKFLLEAEPAAVTIHWRRRRETYGTPAHWDQAAVVVQAARDLGSEALIIGNGDVANRAEARRLCRETGVDGVMFGRAALGNPWLFDETAKAEDISCERRLRVMLEHMELYETTFGRLEGRWPQRPFAMMKKHFKAYASGFYGARELRTRLMQTRNYQEVKEITEAFLAT